jgi:hypothetical protein
MKYKKEERKEKKRLIEPVARVCWRRVWKRVSGNKRPGCESKVVVLLTDAGDKIRRGWGMANDFGVFGRS